MFSKTLLCVLFVFTGTLGASMKHKEAIAIIENCASKTNVSRGEYERPEIFLYRTPSEAQLCMIKCVMQEMQMIDSNGKLDKEIISQYISAFNSNIQEEIIICADKTEKISECKDMENYRKCLEPFLYV